jgi:hypothetical protein
LLANQCSNERHQYTAVYIYIKLFVTFELKTTEEIIFDLWTYMLAVSLNCHFCQHALLLYSYSFINWHASSTVHRINNSSADDNDEKKCHLIPSN